MEQDDGPRWELTISEEPARAIVQALYVNINVYDEDEVKEFFDNQLLAVLRAIGTQHPKLVEELPDLPWPMRWR